MFNIVEFFERRLGDGTTSRVEFVELSRHRKHESIKILIDADTCLDRLYGGMFSNWISGGGDWSRFHEFQRNLQKCCFQHNIQIAFYFNGTSPKKEHEFKQWMYKERKVSENVKTVLDSHKQHAYLWVKPVNLVKQLIIETANNDQLNRKVIHAFTSVKNHQKEIIEFCKLNGYENLITNDPELFLILLSQPSLNIKLFSARSFTLTHNGGLHAVQYNLDAIKQGLDLNYETHYPLFAALVGNLFTSDVLLKRFFEKLIPNERDKFNSENRHTKLLSALIGYFHAKITTSLIEKETEKIINDIWTDDQDRKRKRDMFLEAISYYSQETHINWVVSMNDEIHAESERERNIPQRRLSDCFDDKYEIGETLEESDRSSLGNLEQRPSKRKPNYITTHECGNKSNRISVDTTFRNLKQLHIRSHISPWLLPAYYERRIFLPGVLEEKKTSRVRSHKLYRPLRKKAYDLLLNSSLKQSSNQKIFIEEYEYGNTDYVKYEVKIDHLDERYSDFNLEEIWCEKCTSEKKRFELVMDCLDIVKRNDKDDEFEVDFENLCLINDKTYLVQCAVLRYMLKNTSIISQLDLKAFICTFIYDYPSVEKKDLFLYNLQTDIDRIETRNVHLATLFMSGVENLSFVNDVCGTPIPLRSFQMCDKFNGRIFQHFRQNTAKSVIEFYHEKADKASLYYKLYDIITDGLLRLIVKPPGLSEALTEMHVNQRPHVSMQSLGRGRLFEGSSVKSLTSSMETQHATVADSSCSPCTRRRNRNAMLANFEDASKTVTDYNNNETTKPVLIKKPYDPTVVGGGGFKLDPTLSYKNAPFIRTRTKKQSKYTDEELYILSLFNIDPDKEEEEKAARQKEWDENPWLRGKPPIRGPKPKPVTNEDLIRAYKSGPRAQRDLVIVQYFNNEKEREEYMERERLDAIDDAKMLKKLRDEELNKKKQQQQQTEI